MVYVGSVFEQQRSVHNPGSSIGNITPQESGVIFIANVSCKIGREKSFQKTGINDVNECETAHQVTRKESDWDFDLLP